MPRNKGREPIYNQQWQMKKRARKNTEQATRTRTMTTRHVPTTSQTYREQMNFYHSHLSSGRSILHRSPDVGMPRKWTGNTKTNSLVSNNNNNDNKKKNSGTRNPSTVYWFPTRSSECPAAGATRPSINGLILSALKHHQATFVHPSVRLSVLLHVYPSQSSVIRGGWVHKAPPPPPPFRCPSMYVTLDLYSSFLLPATVILAVSCTTWNSGASPEISHR